MADLPSGTVTLLFSDIEGSTALLSRLGADYAIALTGERQVLRKAWAEHGGTEMGTEGDSFFVSFETASSAVSAAAQAQRGLAEFAWPGGEQVRVRIGIHSGSPILHDGGYVGLDVHRAARIAGAAHGGQVVMSSACAELAGTTLPKGSRLRDLGLHKLKDIAVAEHLFQLVLVGLKGEFPPLRSLGPASSLPMGPTPLVGRDAELAELASLLGSPDIRLVTLTGPGGSGKTRLAIAAADRLMERFPAGVYFVSLAVAATTDVMWTSIADALDLPGVGRLPPGLIEQIAHRRLLLVLDNLEQLAGADAVVAELLEGARQVVVVATSRRALGLPFEHVHSVPPLDVPQSASGGDLEASAAVKLFVQQARMVRPGFALDGDNARDVVAACRRLDGLPLAIELAAARVRLLSPRALVSRLDEALDIVAPGSQGLARHRTLRDTVAWSYNLLDELQQSLFRALGVFAGGADLAGIAAVLPDDPAASGLDLVAALADASLVTVAEDVAGEPRFGMLATIRAYALDRLRSCGEEERVRGRHALHYVVVAEGLTQAMEMGDERRLEVRGRFTLDQDNFREALRWSLPADTQPTSPVGGQIGLRLASELFSRWVDRSDLTEASRWLELAISAAGDEDSPELARALIDSAGIARGRGAIHERIKAARRSVEMWSRLSEDEGRADALSDLSGFYAESGDLSAAREAGEEALALAREGTTLLGWAQAGLAEVESLDHNWARSLELIDASICTFRDARWAYGVLAASHNKGCILSAMGRLGDAEQLLRQQIPEALRIDNPSGRIMLAEDYAAVLAQLGDLRRTGRLLGSAESSRKQHNLARDPARQSDIEELLSQVRSNLTAEQWTDGYERGHGISIETALGQAYSATLD